MENLRANSVLPTLSAFWLLPSLPPRAAAFTSRQPCDLRRQNRRLDRLGKIALHVREQPSHVIVRAAHGRERERRNPAAAVRLQRLYLTDESVGIAVGGCGV